VWIQATKVQKAQREARFCFPNNPTTFVICKCCYRLDGIFINEMQDCPQEGHFMGGDHRTWIRNPVFGDKSSMMLQQHAFFGTSFVSRGNISRFIGHVVFSTKLYYGVKVLLLCQCGDPCERSDGSWYGWSTCVPNMVAFFLLPNAGDWLISQRTHACPSGSGQTRCVMYQLRVHGTWWFALGACVAYIHVTSRFLEGLGTVGESFHTGSGREPLFFCSARTSSGRSLKETSALVATVSYFNGTTI